MHSAEGTQSVLHGALPWLVAALEWVAAGIDLISIAIILVGAIRFILGCLRGELSRSGGRDRLNTMERERMVLGRYVLAGLELLIVSDIIHTALSLKLSDLLFLGLLVLIRSLISFFLERELKDLEKELDT